MRKVVLGAALSIGMLAGCHNAPVMLSAAVPPAPSQQTTTQSMAEYKRSIAFMATQYMQAYDRNHDGSLSQTEADAFMNRSQFAQLDTNHDGQISLPEFIASANQDAYKWFHQRAVEIFAAQDTNQDKVLTFDEFAGGEYGMPRPTAAGYFNQGDRNHDGRLTYAEFENTLAWEFVADGMSYLPGNQPSPDPVVSGSPEPSVSPSPIDPGPIPTASAIP